MIRMLSPVIISTISWVLVSCLMVSSQITDGDIEKGQFSTKITCPLDSLLYASYCYTLFTTPTSWMDANIACQKRPSGSLTPVLTRSEACFLTSLIKNTMDNDNDVWIGLHDPTEGREQGAGWEWSTADKMTYRAWESGAPSNQNFGYCGSLSEKSDFQKWKEHYCDLKLPYICKFRS